MILGKSKSQRVSRHLLMVGRNLARFGVLALLLVIPSLQAGTVSIGPGGFLQKDGQPVFVIGAYNPPKEKSARDVAQMGFNLLRVGSSSEEWEACRENDLWIWHSFDLDFSGEAIDKKKESIAKTVADLSNHPNLFMWESVDEPAWTDGEPEKARVSPEPLIEGYRFLKGLDSHPVYLNHAPRNTIETLRRYNPAADILCVDVYPIIPRNLDATYAIIPPAGPIEVPRQTDLPDLSPAVVGDYVDKMKQVAFHDQAVFLVLQGFAWEALKKPEEQKPADLVYPTRDQLRFMAFQAIIHGVNGLTVWGLSYNQDETYLSDLSAVLNEVDGLSPEILGHRTGDQPTLRYYERGSGVLKGIESLTTETEEGVTLFTVNASINPAKVKFTTLPMAFDGATELEVLGENRKVPVEQGAFVDEYDGLGVHLYRYPRTP